MSKLMALTEAFQTSFTITISIDGKEIHRESLPLLLMPFDQWHGDYVMPELLASFVTPNHPCLAPILQRAADKLQLQESLNFYRAQESQSESDSFP